MFNEKYSKTEIDSTYDEFWLIYVSEKKYPTLKLLIVKMCTIFGSTYKCIILKTNSDLDLPTNTLKR
ncbi:hypothetical protein QTP88_019133 [Uroleucon formosanum]